MFFDVGLSNIEMCTINGSSDKQSVLKLGGTVYASHSIMVKHLKWLSSKQLLVRAFFIVEYFSIRFRGFSKLFSFLNG